VDASVTDVAIQALNGMELGDRYLVVQRASVGAKPGMPALPYEQFPELPRPIMPAGETARADARILLMLSMVVPEDLADDQEYADVCEDIREECEKYGAVEDLRVPRPAKRDRAGKWGEQGQGGQGGQVMSAADYQRVDEAAGVGRVYVKFRDAEAAGAALKSLAGRSFGGRSIIATLLNDESQTTPPLHVIFAPQPDAPPPLPM
jgi:splicing factor U2AF 65 kDa subunit